MLFHSSIRQELARSFGATLVVLVTNLRDEDDQELLTAVKRISRQHRVLVASLREEVLECDALTHDCADGIEIGEVVKDPKTAEKLIPKNHGFGTRRLPLETRYYEVYNQPNVELVDLLETPIERVTPAGIRTTARDFEFDMIIYATGFDALTGAYDAMFTPGQDAREAATRFIGRFVEVSAAHPDLAGVRVGQAASVRFLGYGAEQFAARVQAVLASYVLK